MTQFHTKILLQKNSRAINTFSEVAQSKNANMSSLPIYKKQGNNRFTIV